MNGHHGHWCITNIRKNQNLGPWSCADSARRSARAVSNSCSTEPLNVSSTTDASMMTAPEDMFSESVVPTLKSASIRSQEKYEHIGRPRL